MNTEAPKEAPVVEKKPVSLSTAIDQVKIFLAGLVSGNLELAIAIMHLAKLDFERMYTQQMQFAELKRMNDEQTKAKAAADAASAATAVPAEQEPEKTESAAPATAS